MLTEKDIKEETVGRIRREIQSSFPLGKFPQESAIREKAKNLMEDLDITSEAVNKMLGLRLNFQRMAVVNSNINDGIKQCIEEWVTMCSEYKDRFQEINKTFLDRLFEPVKAFVGAQQAFDPDLDFDVLEKIIDEGVEKVREYFRQQWLLSMKEKVSSMNGAPAPTEGNRQEVGATTMTQKSSKQKTINDTSTVQQEGANKRRQDNEGANSSGPKKLKITPTRTQEVSSQTLTKTSASPGPATRFMNKSGSGSSPNQPKKTSLTQNNEAPHNPKLSQSNEKNGQRKGPSDFFKNVEFFLLPAPGTTRDPRNQGSITTPKRTIYEPESLRKKIEDFGGKVLMEIGEEKAEQVFLISNGTAFTTEHLYSQAKGIPCVYQDWVLKCIEQNAIVQWSQFAASVLLDYEGGVFKPLKLIKLLNHGKKPLRGYKIFFASGVETVDQLVLHASEVIVLNASGKKLIPDGTQVVIGSNFSVNEKLITEAKNKGVPVVTSTWFTRTVVDGVVAGYNDFQVKLV